MKNLLAIILLLSSFSAFAENRGVAAVLGLKDSSVADAVESGAGEAWNKFEKENDATLRKMNEEKSVFLRNAPHRESAPEAPAKVEVARERGGVQAQLRRTEVEKERNLALQQLEFRRNVEDAMKRILSFSPSIRPGAERAEVPRAVDAMPESQIQGVEVAPASPRDRLLQSAANRPSPFRGVSHPSEEWQGAPSRSEESVSDPRDSSPERFQASPDDDEGKPVRVSATGDSDGADFPVINMRQGSRKAAPAITKISGVGKGPEGTSSYLKALPGLQSNPQNHSGF